MFRKEQLLLHSLHCFFDLSTHQQTLLKIIEGKSKISLRLLDWFVTNYARTHSTTIRQFSLSKNHQYCLIYLDYKAQLKAFSKKYFDPFCRRNRITFFFNDNSFIETTVGQLNFFRWVIQSGCLQYLQKNLAEIEDAMNLYYKKNRNQKKQTKKSKVNKHENMKIILTFK